MPTNTLAVVDGDFVGNPLQLTRWLVGSFEELSATSDSTSQLAIDAISGRQIQREVHISESLESNIQLEEDLGELVPMTCPECSGPLWELRVDKVRRYRCHTDHAYTSRALITHQDETIEKALWASMRLMQERANSLEQLAHDKLAGSDIFLTRANESRANANVLRNLLVGSCKPDNLAEAEMMLNEQAHV